MKKREIENIDVSGQVKLLDDLKLRIAKERKNAPQIVFKDQVVDVDAEYKKQAAAISEVRNIKC